MYANAIFVPILPGLKQPSIKHIVTDSGMHLIITDEKRKTEVENFKENVRVLNLGIDKSSDFRNTQEVLNKNGNNEPIEYKRIGTDLAAIIYSSGSTGRPKGIMVTNRNFWDGAQIVSHYLNTNERDRIAAILSFNFDYGLNQIWQSLFTGASLHLHELVMPNDCIKFIYTEGITALPLMPVIISKLFDIKMFNRNHGYDLSKVRYVCSSGGRISLDMLKNIKSEFQKANFYSMYGLTEAFRSTYLSPEQIEQRPNSIGMAIPDVEILILDEDGLECKVGSIGELVHRGGCIARGYWNDPEKTAERFRTHPKYPGEILVYSGDLVTKDVDGYITFVARKDGMLKNNGIRISPTEIEEVFEMHDDVSAAIVFGILYMITQKL
jgi:acyl-CoA synthetase (AMP-forming)/AMP-acid ligase II